MSVVGILIALGLLVWLAYRGWTILLLAPLSALIAALLAGQPLLANWTQTFMSNAAGFVAQFFPIFLLGALFGKLMEASGSVEAIAKYLTERLGTKRAMLAIVLAGAFVTYGGVSLFVAFFVLAPMGHALFKAANIPHRLMLRGHRHSAHRRFRCRRCPGGGGPLVLFWWGVFVGVGGGLVFFCGTPAIQNAIPMPFFGTRNQFHVIGLARLSSTPESREAFQDRPLLMRPGSGARTAVGRASATTCSFGGWLREGFRYADWSQPCADGVAHCASGGMAREEIDCAAGARAGRGLSPQLDPGCAVPLGSRPIPARPSVRTNRWRRALHPASTIASHRCVAVRSGEPASHRGRRGRFRFEDAAGFRRRRVPGGIGAPASPICSEGWHTTDRERCGETRWRRR